MGSSSEDPGTDGRFIRQVRVSAGADTARYPFTLPAVGWLARAEGLELGRGVTFLVGENGTGKSTLIEAIAVAAGMNPEGGSQNFSFATRSSESSLGDHLVLTRGTCKPRSRYFLRAESYYNVASEIERLDKEPGPPLLSAYGGTSPHERSCGGPTSSGPGSRAVTSRRLEPRHMRVVSGEHTGWVAHRTTNEAIRRPTHRR